MSVSVGEVTVEVATVNPAAEHEPRDRHRPELGPGWAAQEAIRAGMEACARDRDRTAPEGLGGH